MVLDTLTLSPKSRKGVYEFTLDWSISSLPNGVDSNPDIYPPSLKNFVLVHDSLFYERPSGNKDHPNACLCYMLYCLTIEKTFNLAYYIAKRIESVTKSDIMTLPYGMLLTRLFEHVRISHLFAIKDNHYLVDHVMIPLSKRRVFRIIPKGKDLTLKSNSYGVFRVSPTPHQEEEENNLVNNYALDPISHIDQLLPIE
nr:hypothetical protein [Tanacetum cinerariifolium]